MQRPSDLLVDVRDQLFFLMGCERSGTTLLQTMLQEHSQVAIASETQFYGAFYQGDPRSRQLAGNRRRRRVIQRVSERLSHRGLAFDSARFEELAEEAEATWDGLFTAFIAAFGDMAKASRIGEKSPAHTRFLGHLADAFPKSRFVLILRDPRAVVLSRRRVPFGSRFLGANVEVWRQACGVHFEASQALGAERYLAVRYEDLVRDPEATLRAVCRFLGLTWEPQILEFDRRKEPGFDAGEWAWKSNTLRPVFTDSVDRWRQDLRPDEVAVVEYVLGQEMSKLGYRSTGASTRFPGARFRWSRSFGKLERWSRRLGRGVVRRWERFALRVGGAGESSSSTGGSRS